jgi:hypothetical protein
VASPVPLIGPEVVGWEIGACHLGYCILKELVAAMSTALLKPSAGRLGRFPDGVVLRLVPPEYRGTPAIITPCRDPRRNHEDRRRHDDLPPPKSATLVSHAWSGWSDAPIGPVLLWLKSRDACNVEAYVPEACHLQQEQHCRFFGAEILKSTQRQMYEFFWPVERVIGPWPVTSPRGIMSFCRADAEAF